MILRIKWPGDREEALEYMVGLITGDGVIEKYRVEVYDKSEAFLRLVKTVVLEKYLHDTISSIRIDYRKRVNGYRLRVYGREFVNKIKDYYEPPLSINFIRGFFDAEGSIWYNPNLIAEITNKNLKLLEKIKQVLQQHGINSKIHQDRSTYKVRMTTMRRFMEIIGLRHPRHIAKITCSLNSYEKAFLRKQI